MDWAMPTARRHTLMFLDLMQLISEICHLSGAESVMFHENYQGKTKSATMVLTKHNKRILTFHGQGFQPPAPSLWQEIIRNAYIYFCVSWKKIQHALTKSLRPDGIIWHHGTGLILGLGPANETSLQSKAVFHWMCADLNQPWRKLVNIVSSNGLLPYSNKSLSII